MKALDRYQWLLTWIKSKGPTDVLNRDFVDEYLDATGANYRATCWGAYKCPMLGRDLGHMAKVGALKRSRLGLSGGSWMPGFPKWVWSYAIGHAAYLYEPKGDKQ